jgi:hypothetical protein
VLSLLLSLTLALASADDRGAFRSWVAAPVDATPGTGVPDGVRRPAPLERAPSSPLAAARAGPGYRFAEGVYAEIDATMATSPAAVEVERIGTSVLGRPLWAFHVTGTGPTVRRVLVFGGIHALEWISTEVAHELLLELLRGGAPAGVRVTVIPLLNPDGRARVEGDLAADEERYRRGNAKNVDLNRDFAVNRAPRAAWRGLIPGYYATSAEPLSQPESRALDALADRERYHRAASLHSFGGFFYAPWAGRSRAVPQADREELWALGRAMEVAWGTRAYRTRQLGRWSFFFRAHGSEIDHLYGRYGTRAFLVEVTRSGVRPLRPRTWRWGFETYNPSSPRRYRKHRDRTVRSLGALIGHPELPAERAAREAGSHGLPRPIATDEEERSDRRR